jgi:peptide/nickel transport system substrate-binding protein
VHRYSNRLAIVVPIAVLALGAGACSSKTKTGTSSPTSSSGAISMEAVKDGGSLIYGADQEPTGFNDLTSKDNGTSVVNVVEAVLPSAFHAQPDFTVKMDSDFLVSADVTNKSPQTIVYKIKPEAKWSNGDDITADDFIYLWKHQNGSNKDLDVASTTGYTDIDKVEGSDNGKTVTVTFKNNFSDWKSLFSYILPSKYMGTLGADPAAWNDGLDKTLPVSGGPYTVGEWKAGESLTLTRNDKYWGPKAHLDSVVFRFLPESTTQPAALQNGEVDLIYPQPQLDQVTQVKGLPDVKSEINFGLSFEHLDFNFKNSFLADINVRKAIALGVNVQAIVDSGVKQFSSKASVLGNRIWLTGQPQYKDNAGPYQKGDTAAAEKALTDGGYTKGADGIYAKDGKPIALRFSTTAGNAAREAQGQLFQAQMKTIGIKINIDNAPSKEFFGKRLPQGNFDIADFAWVGTPFTISSNQAIYTDTDSNYGKYSNPKVDDLFKQALAELDETKAADLSNQIDQQIWTDVATIPLYQKPTFIAYKSKFGNIHDNATSEGPFYNAGQWGVKQSAS